MEWSVAVGGNPVAVTSGDFNGDGRVDLATANSSAGHVTVLLGKGNGTLLSFQSFSVGDNPRSVTMGDFNSDGIIDLAAANLSADSVSVLLGVGDGTFRPDQSFTVEKGPGPWQPMISTGTGFLTW